MIERRSYPDYESYVRHQLGEEWHSPTTVEIMLGRLDHLLLNHWIGEHTRALCLGARRGEEVAALRRLGIAARGINLKPMPPASNPSLVEQGDFNRLVETFGAHSFDLAYTNSIDHAFDLRMMFEQVHGVLSQSGIFVVDFFPGAFGPFEAMKIETIDDVLGAAKVIFKLTEQYNDGVLPGIYKVYQNIQLVFIRNP